MKKNCLSCNSKKLNKLFFLKKFPILFGAIPLKIHKTVGRYPIEISTCKVCGLVQQSKIPSQRLIDEIYTAEYYSCGSPLTSGMGIREIEKFLTFFKKCKNKPKKLLEIACFDGYALKKISNLGWDVYGCDPSPMVKIAKKNLGNKRIKKVFFSQKTYANQKFDAIVFRNLLEHITDLNGFLKDVYKSLNFEGKIFIDVPNIKEIAKFGGLGLFFHQHISYFSIETLKYLLKRNNFKITKYYEGNPNIFLEAKKDNYINEKKIKNKLIRKKYINKNYLKIKKKIFSLFENKKINKIVLFGASALSTSIVSLLSDKQRKKIVFVIDNDKLKQNKILSGTDIMISSPKILLSKKFDVVLISSYFFVNEMKKDLKKLGINRLKINTVV